MASSNQQLHKEVAQKKLLQQITRDIQVFNNTDAISKLSKLKNINSNDSDGNTLLHHAIKHGNTEIAFFLINAGCDVKQKNLAKRQAKNYIRKWLKKSGGKLRRQLFDLGLLIELRQGYKPVGENSERLPPTEAVFKAGYNHTHFALQKTENRTFNTRRLRATQSYFSLPEKTKKTSSSSLGLRRSPKVIFDNQDRQLKLF